MWHINHDNLKRVDFHKIMDPFTIFQEIQMWLSGVLPKDGPPMVAITDDIIKRDKHGFDKWSFKKKKEMAI